MKEKLKKLMLIFVLVGLYAGAVHGELIALWEFDFGTATDSNGDNNGILYGDPDWVTGHIGGALHFDGVDDYVDFGSEVSRDINNQISVATWVKTDDAGNGECNPYVANGDRYFILWHLESNEIEFTVNIGEVGWKGVRFPVDSSFNNSWHHLVGTYNSEELCVYVDGKLKADSECEGLLIKGVSRLNIGRDPEKTSNFFEGAIDDVCIFNHALTEDEVERLYERSGVSFVPKGYMAGLIEEAEVAVKELEAQEAISFLDNEIAEYEKWKAKNFNYINKRDSQLSPDVYFLLARAKEAAGAPAQEVIEMYKQSVLQPHRPSNYIPAALLWLSEKTPMDVYISIVKECIRNSNEPSRSIYHIAGFFESQGNWAGLELILDAVFSDEDQTVLYAQAVAKGLGQNKQWGGKFSEYCQSKPECTRYVFHEQEKIAERYAVQKDFKKAAEVYHDILNRCGPRQEKAIYEFKRCECLFNDGQYESVVQDLEIFVKDNKAAHRTLVIKAIMLEGRAYVQVGNIDRAIETFLTLLIEYPRTKQATEANFFIGYCYMLQGKFRQATEAFNLLVKDYPESDYVAKAESYLARIKKMTD
jgi:tetratricopeptide (TPR) repeat protein